jgi:short-subunit dehydrogenase
VEAISDALRLGVAPFGVQVVLVQPGPVVSAFVDSAVDSVDVTEGPYAQFTEDLVDRYRDAYDGSAANLGITPEKVADVIVSAATSADPRPRHAVRATAKALITTRRLLPDLGWDAVVRQTWPTPKRSTRRQAAPSRGQSRRLSSARYQWPLWT